MERSRISDRSATGRIRAMKRTDAQIREILAKAGLTPPDKSLGRLRDVRFCAATGDWYISTGPWRVYYYTDKVWAHCPMKESVGDD